MELIFKFFEGAVKIFSLIINKRKEDAELEKHISIKVIELERSEREHKRDRDALFHELGGYTVQRDGILNFNPERFPSYEAVQKMEDFDRAHNEEKAIIQAELRSLYQQTGGPFIVSSQKKPSIKKKVLKAISLVEEE
jgi:hypothetical protein